MIDILPEKRYKVNYIGDCYDVKSKFFVDEAWISSCCHEEIIKKKRGIFTYKVKIMVTDYFIQILSKFRDTRCIWRLDSWDNRIEARRSFNEILKDFNENFEILEDSDFSRDNSADCLINYNIPMFEVLEKDMDDNCILRNTMTDVIYIGVYSNHRIVSLCPYYSSNGSIMTYREWKVLEYKVKNRKGTDK